MSVDRQCGNMSGITLTHQPTDCVTSALRLTRPALRHSSSIYTEQVKIILSATSFTVGEAVPSSLLFVAALVERTQNIAHIPIKPLCTTKFKAIIHNMPEIGVQTVPVPLDQCSDERVTNIINEAPAYSLFSFTSLRPQGSAKPSPFLTHTTP